MEAPKEIYISNDHHGWYPENNGGDKVKYIRADIAEKAKNEFYNKGYLDGRKNAYIPARELGLPKSCDNPNLEELTWEDIENIEDIIFDVRKEFRVTDRKLFLQVKEEMYREVLRRFLESKKHPLNIV